MNVFQAALVCAFNTKDDYTYGELRNITNIPKQQLNGGLLQLCNPKFGVLNKAVKKPKFDDDNEKISFNKKFGEKLKNIRVNVMPTPSKEEKKDTRIRENEATMEGVMRERGQIIDAHLVKQMKTNKTMDMKTLMTKVQDSITTFRAKEDLIKQRVEYLITQEYIERDPNNRAKLIYIP